MPLFGAAITTGTPPRVNFDWSPKSVALITTIGGNTYPYSHQADSVSRASDTRYETLTTPTNQSITFVADVTAHDGETILEYVWNFGNGIAGYGPTASYTFRVPNPSHQVSLLVRDSANRDGSAIHYLNLVKTAPTVVKPTIRV